LIKVRPHSILMIFTFAVPNCIGIVMV